MGTPTSAVVHDYLGWCRDELGTEWASMASLSLATGDGTSVLVHKDVLGAVCKVAAGLASVTDGEGGAVDWTNQLDALRVITRQCSSAAVRCFLCEVYRCSGIVKAKPPGEAGLWARWQGLAVEDQRSALRLADMLGAAAVLQQWDAMLASQATPALRGTGGLVQQLLLADAFQQQLPLFYKDCLAAACVQVREGDEALLGKAAELTPATCAVLLAASEEERKREAMSHADTKKRLEEALAAHGTRAAVQSISDPTSTAGLRQGEVVLNVEPADPNEGSQCWSLDCCSALAGGAATTLISCFSAVWAICLTCLKAAVALLVLTFVILTFFLGFSVASPFVLLCLVPFGVGFALRIFGVLFPEEWTPAPMLAWVQLATPTPTQNAMA